MTSVSLEAALLCLSLVGMIFLAARALSKFSFGVYESGATTLLFVLLLLKDEEVLIRTFLAIGSVATLHPLVSSGQWWASSLFNVGSLLFLLVIIPCLLWVVFEGNVRSILGNNPWASVIGALRPAVMVTFLFAMSETSVSVFSEALDLISS